MSFYEEEKRGKKNINTDYINDNQPNHVCVRSGSLILNYYKNLVTSNEIVFKFSKVMSSHYLVIKSTVSQRAFVGRF